MPSNSTSESFLERLHGGERLSGIQLTSESPHWPKLLADALDFIFIDTEHHCFGRKEVAYHCVAYAAAGITPMVRVLKADGALIRATIDDGAKSIVVPYIENVTQVQECVAAAKLRPIQGELATQAVRGGGLSEAQTRFINQHCEEISLIIQIESELAVSRLDELASQPGVDGLLVGPFDLTASLGIPKQFNSEKLKEAAKRIADTAIANKIAAGIYFANNLEMESWAFANGYQFMVHGCDWSLISEAMGQRLAARNAQD
ncbi:MAG: aldolase/citrate lyase family protein [Planctomycetota bacterium]